MRAALCVVRTIKRVSMEAIKGYIEHVIYRNTDNGYTVLNLVCGENEITCVGFFKTMDQGEMIEADDTETLFTHPRDERTADYVAGRFG